MPETSVILPVYNASATIRETINSVLNQTYTDYELIIIDDGSSDDTLEKINTINDSRITVHTIPNSGPSSARNKGIELAKSKYIAFIDADDLWTRDKLEKQLDKLKKNPDFDVVYSWTNFIDEQGNYLHPVKTVNFEGDIYEDILIRNFIGNGSNILVTKNALVDINGFNPEYLYSEDWDLFIRLSKKYKFGLVKEFLVDYRQNLSSLSSDIESLELNTLKVIEKSYKDAPSNLRNLKKDSLSSFYIYVAYLYLTRQPDNNWRKKVIDKICKCIKLRFSNIFNTSIIFTITLLLFSFFVSNNYSKRFVLGGLKSYGTFLTKFKNW